MSMKSGPVNNLTEKRTLRYSFACFELLKKAELQNASAV